MIVEMQSQSTYRIKFSKSNWTYETRFCLNILSMQYIESFRPPPFNIMSPCLKLKKKIREELSLALPLYCKTVCKNN